MSEILRPVPHALIARFIYGDETKKYAVSANQYPLTPGNGIVFVGEEDKTSDAYSFEQSELEYTLRHIQPGTLQLMTLLDQNTGSLFMTRGTPEQSWGINKDVPREKRFVGFELGRLQFAGIWGESIDEVQETLRALQELRRGMN